MMHYKVTLKVKN